MDVSARAHPIFHPSPRADAHTRVSHHGLRRHDKMRFFLYRDVLEELCFAAQYQQEALLGVLTGQFGLEDAGPFLEVTGFEALRALPEPEGLYDALRRALDEVFGCERSDSPLIGARPLSPAGFFVHQPGCGVVPSDASVAAHLGLFNLPFQLLMVMDQPGDALACYARSPAGRFFDASIHLVSTLSPPQEGSPPHG